MKIQNSLPKEGCFVLCSQIYLRGDKMMHTGNLEFLVGDSEVWGGEVAFPNYPNPILSKERVPEVPDLTDN